MYPWQTAVLNYFALSDEERQASRVCAEVANRRASREWVLRMTDIYMLANGYSIETTGGGCHVYRKEEHRG